MQNNPHARTLFENTTLLGIGEVFQYDWRGSDRNNETTPAIRATIDMRLEPTALDKTWGTTWLLSFDYVQTHHDKGVVGITVPNVVTHHLPVAEYHTYDSVLNFASILAYTLLQGIELAQRKDTNITDDDIPF